MNNTTHPVLWDENTVIEDKDGKRYSWSLPHGYRGSQHLTTWGRKLLCGQASGYGQFEHPFGSERACQVCIRIALKLVERWEAKQAAPVTITLTKDELENLHLLINRAEQAYKADAEYWCGRALTTDGKTGPNSENIQANADWTSQMVDTAQAIRSLVINAKN